MIPQQMDDVTTALLEALCKDTWGMGRMEAIESNTCLECHKHMDEDETYYDGMQYTATGLCSDCYDKFNQELESRKDMDQPSIVVIHLSLDPLHATRN
jgi:protein-arginine kinase activator protein McsA